MLKLTADELWDEAVDCGKYYCFYDDGEVKLCARHNNGNDTMSISAIDSYGEEIYYETSITKDEFGDTIERVCEWFVSESADYTYGEAVDESAGTENCDEEPSTDKRASDERSEIEDREDELHAAARDFLGIVLADAWKDGAEKGMKLCDRLVDEVFKWLYKNGVDCYRPMYLKDEKSKEIEYYQYPYEYLV